MEINNWINSRDCLELARLVPGFVTCSDGSIFINDSRNERPHIRVTQKGFYDLEHDISGGYISLASLIATEHKEPVCIQISKWYVESLKVINDVDDAEQQILRSKVSELMGYID